MRSDLIYLDYQASTPTDPRVIDTMIPFLVGHYGNPSSPHVAGRKAAAGVAHARDQVCELVGARYESEIIFTSGATEADHLALAGIAAALADDGNHIITTAIEHRAVLACSERLRQEGVQVTCVPVDHQGVVDPAEIAAAITDRTILVSVMHANNEIGTIQPISEISEITHAKGVLLHTDAAQSLTSVSFDVDALQVDLASFSAHKIYGPKGAGALYIRRGIRKPRPQLPGGGQEYGMRAGTPNVPGIVGFGTAASILLKERQADANRIEALRDRLQARLANALPLASINGPMADRLAGNISITVPGIDADQVLSEMTTLAISTGSACGSGTAEPSHVLTAIGLARPDARATLRISIGRPTTIAEIDFAGDQLIEVISRHLTVPPQA
jgi:cysteine desulfurase